MSSATPASQFPSADFRLALEASPNGMILVQPDGTIAYANGLAQEMFATDDLVGNDVDDLVPEQARGHHAHLRDSYLASPERRTMGAGRDLQAVRVDGTTFPVEVGLNPIAIHGKTWVLCSIVDITTRLAQEERAREAETKAMESQRLESLGLLAGGLAHDFNNLLVGVIGNARLALDTARDADVQECLEDVLVAADQAALLARQMLAYSGGGKFVVQEQDLSDVVAELTPLLRSSVPRTIELRIRTAHGLPTIQADGAQLKQVLLNLVNNALDAIGHHQAGTIRVSTGRIAADAHYLSNAFPEGREPGEYVYVDVSDTGSGMSEAVRRRIFEPFFTTKQTGHGLGLAATLGIVRSHGGCMVVYSEPGEGTRMHVLFPVANDRSASHRTTLGTVLIAEDDPVVRRFAVRALKSAGYATVQAEDGEEALRRVREGGPIDVVLMDMSMPRLGGVQALRTMREIAPGVPVILMSGYAVEALEARIGDAAPDAFLQKPFVGADLLARIRELRTQDS